MPASGKAEEILIIENEEVVQWLITNIGYAIPTLRQNLMKQI